MKYTPSLPPVAEAPDNTALREIQRAQVVHALRERLFPARITGHYPLRQEDDLMRPDSIKDEEKRQGQERRDHCRRITPAKPLLETRSDVERRKKNRRHDDIATSVDDEA